MAPYRATVRRLKAFAADTRGATIIEYAFIISLVSIAIGFTIPEIRAGIEALFVETATGISNAAGQPPTP